MNYGIILLHCESFVRAHLSLSMVLVAVLFFTSCGGDGAAVNRSNINTLPAAVNVSISPTTANVPAGGSQIFTATITGTSNNGVSWAVQEGSAGGSVTSAGVYTAPQVAGAYHVVATSLADTSKSASAIVTVPPVSVTDGGYVYVANSGSDNVSAYTINGTTGALTPISGSPFAAGRLSSSVTVAPTGQFAYVANGTSHNISAYRIDATGALTAIAGSPFVAGAYPRSVTVNRSGEFAYVANSGSDNVSAYTINRTTGALTAISGSPFAAGRAPSSVTVGPTGQFAYVANYTSNNISAYGINGATGVLTPVVGSPFAAGDYPSAVTVHPSGKFAYVLTSVSYTMSIATYTIDTSTGALTPAGTVAAGLRPWGSVAVDPSGKFAYVANYGSIEDGIPGGVSLYGINAATGNLTAGGTERAGLSPISVAVDHTGRFAYVVNSDSNDVSAYTINGATGALTPVAGSPFPAGVSPISVTTTAGPVQFN